MGDKMDDTRTHRKRAIGIQTVRCRRKVDELAHISDVRQRLVFQSSIHRDERVHLLYDFRVAELSSRVHFVQRTLETRESDVRSRRTVDGDLDVVSRFILTIVQLHCELVLGNGIDRERERIRNDSTLSLDDIEHYDGS